MQEHQIMAVRSALNQLIARDKFKELEQELRALGEQVSTVLNAPCPGNLPLVAASIINNLEAVKILIQYGADVNARNHENLSPLDSVYNILHTAYSTEDFKKIMECALYMFNENVKNNLLAKYTNSFTLYMLRLQKYASALQQFKENYYDEWFAVIKKLDESLQYVRENGGDDLIKYAEELTRSGHILGIETTANLLINAYNLSVKSEDNQTLFSKYYLHEILSEYLSLDNLGAQTKKRFKYILDAFEEKSKYIKIVATGWPGHDVYLAQIGSYIILCNRGEYPSPRTKGVKIFQARSSDVDITELKTRAYKSSVFEERFAKMVDLDNPTYVFSEIKGQKHGTCSFVNAKSIIAPLLKLLGDGEAYKTYKKFTSWMRDRELDHLLAKFSLARLEKHVADRKFYFQVLVKYAMKIMANEKPGTKKDAADNSRFAKILDVFAVFGKGRELMEKLNAFMEHKQESHQDLMQNPEFKAMFESPIIVHETQPPTPHITEVEVPNADINFKAFKCTDEELKQQIFTNFKQRKLDIALMIQNKLPVEAIDQEISKLKADWENFVHAVGQKQILDVAKDYVAGRKQLWIISSIFTPSNEQECLRTLENYIVTKLGLS